MSQNGTFFAIFALSVSIMILKRVNKYFYFNYETCSNVLIESTFPPFFPVLAPSYNNQKSYQRERPFVNFLFPFCLWLICSKYVPLLQNTPHIWGYVLRFPHEAKSTRLVIQGANAKNLCLTAIYGGSSSLNPICNTTKYRGHNESK